MYTVTFHPRVEKEDCPFLDPALAERVEAAIHQKIARDPIRFGKPLQHEWRGCRSLRVGDYRIIYQVDRKSSTVLVTAIGHRRYVYKH